MAEQRIKGQEVEIRITEGGALLETLTDIQNFEMAGILEVITENYLGETSDRKDEIYRGYRGSMSLHFSNRTVLDLMRRIIDRARRRVAGVVINIKATLQFPAGDRVSVVLEDCFFGEIPLSFGSRSDYGSVSLTFEGTDFDVI